ncbi:hypothetical protein NRY95_02060 [Xanthomonas campestris pv. phormiicola]|nr:hypothetical protein [Xanthomonas campestris pv. phormiicola]UYC16791.1 hypothetical protein NRY95_02060 [Xanthomonas campestris pv. phormiicola]
MLLMIAGQVNADGWKYFGGAKILSITEWQGNGPVFIEMESGTYCFIPSDEKNMIALVYSLYANSKAVDIYCNPAESTVFAGMTGDRVHRIATTRL